MPSSAYKHSSKPSTIHDILQSSVLPIGAWVAPPPDNVVHHNPDYITIDSYQLAAEAGFTMLYGLYENIEHRFSDVCRAMDCAQAAGIRYLAASTGIAEGLDVSEVLQRIRASGEEHPAHLGVLAYDEPALSQLDTLGALASSYRENSPDKLFYVNLLPFCALSNQIKINKCDESGPPTTPEEYQLYLSEFIEKLQPPLLSFDNYPCEGAFPHMASHYFLNLSLVTKIARARSLPVWCFIQTCAWNNRVRVPNREEILWQVNTALAYGIKGIQYFTFWQPLADGTWSGGMVNPDGSLNPQYTYVKDVNTRIKLSEELFMHGHFEGVVVHGDSPAPIPPTDNLESYGPLVAVAGEIPVLIGCFSGNGNAGFYAVNNSVTQNGEVMLQFADTVSGIVRWNGTCRSFTSGFVTIKLEAGDAAYIQLD